MKGPDHESLQFLQARRNFKVVGFEMLMNENLFFTNNAG